MAIQTVTIGKAADIRVAPELSMTVSAMVTNTGVSAGADGRKIIKAGTPIGAGATVSSSNDLLRIDSGATALIVDTTYPQGVILHDVDVTAGATPATIMVQGYVDLTKVDTSVATLINTAYGAYNSSTAPVKFMNRK